MRWAKRVRMAFIRDRLNMVGVLNRSAICERFEVSLPQAAADIKTYLGLNPDAMRYDAKLKCYVSTKPASQRGRDTTAAADTLMRSDNEWLREVALRDPDMIRDVAAALIYERTI